MQKQQQQKQQLRQYKQAYADYKAGMPYRDIAELYGVSLSTVKSWQQRYWRKWDSDTSTSSDSADNTQSDSSNSMQSSTHSDAGSMQENSGTRIDVAKPEKVFKAIVQKQIDDTNPARIYAEYSRENLPELTARESRFVEEYIIDLDKKNAAIRAGYSVANADSLGCRLFAKPHINAHIQVALAERLKRSGMNADLAIRELARIARANPIRVVRSDGSIDENASEDDLAAIQAIKVKVTPTKNGDIVEREVRFHDKTRALELYMKAAGMLIERKQVDVTQRVEEMTDDERRQRIRELQSKLAIDIDADVIDD